MSELAVTRTLHIAAQRLVVWAALTEAELISEWFGDSTTIDLRVGGRGTFSWQEHGERDFVIEEIDEPSVFAFRWARSAGGDPVTGPATLVRFTLLDHAGGTELSVVETAWESVDDAESGMRENTEGWIAELDELAAFLEKQDSV